MKCVICRHGETALGKVTVTLEDDEATIIIEVCGTIQFGVTPCQIEKGPKHDSKKR